MVNKLCATLLMEADFNMVNCIIISHRMMQHAEEQNLLLDNHQGGRRNMKEQEGGVYPMLEME